LPADADWDAPWPRKDFVDLQQRIRNGYAFRDINAYEQKLYNPSLEAFRLKLLG
jgi:hypothetical protein